MVYILSFVLKNWFIQEQIDLTDGNCIKKKAYLEKLEITIIGGKTRNKAPTPHIPEGHLFSILAVGR